MKTINQAVSKIDAGYQREVTIGCWEAGFNVKVLPPVAPASSSIKAKSAAGAKPRKLTKKQRKAELLRQIKKNGFEAVTDAMEISKIRLIKSPLAGSKKGGKKLSKSSAVPTSGRLTVEAAGDEVLVALEYDPATGEIIDWHYPVQEVMSQRKVTPSQAAIKSKAKSRKTPKRQVVFEFPLENAYPGTTGQPSAGVSSKSLFKRFKKHIQVFVVKRIKDGLRSLSGKILGKLITPIDRLIVKRPGLKKFDRALKLDKVLAADRRAMKGKTVCLFVHGIISSTAGAFDDLTKEKAFYDDLSVHYGGRLIAYDHWTLSVSTEANAKALAESLPEGVTLDIVCHSRGASVVRSMLELPAIQKIMTDKNIVKGNVCFVAGACEGSPLAAAGSLDRLFNMINKISVVTGKGAIPATGLTLAIKLILGGLQEMPGTSPLDPNGTFLKRLNNSQDTLANKYLYFRANFDASNTPLRLLDEGLIDHVIFQDKGNDVIVPFAGAGKSDNYLKGKVAKKDVVSFGTETKEQSDVWHTTFFGHPTLRNGLKDSLGF